MKRDCNQTHSNTYDDNETVSVAVFCVCVYVLWICYEMYFDIKLKSRGEKCVFVSFLFDFGCMHAYDGYIR